MYKYILPAIFIHLFGGFCFTQNLVPNFSFEQYDTCPTFGDQIQYATGWNKYSNPISSPDYYNSCSPDSAFGVPNSAVSYQPDHRNCSAYAGIITITNNPNEREHIGIQLAQPLVVGQKYFLSFYAVMGSEKKIAGIYYEMPSNNIGVRLSTVAYSPNNPCPIDNWAHINYSTVLNDSINWTRVSGSIIADSAYAYLATGNFFDDANTDTINYNCGSCINNYSYYLIDDVCISTDSLLCNGGIDTISCITSVNEVTCENEIVIFPNPTSDFLNISFTKDACAEIELYDILGNIIYSEKVSFRKNIGINVSSILPGYYFLKMIKSENYFTMKKIIKL